MKVLIVKAIIRKGAKSLQNILASHKIGHEIQKELKGIKKVVDAGVPYLGVRSGQQTLVKANGGNVCKNKVKEVFIRSI